MNRSQCNYNTLTMSLYLLRPPTLCCFFDPLEHVNFCIDSGFFFAAVCHLLLTDERRQDDCADGECAIL